MRTILVMTAHDLFHAANGKGFSIKLPSGGCTLQNVTELKKCKILATDGEIGKVSDFLFDDVSWIIRYLVAGTGSWLNKRKVLIPPSSFGRPDLAEKKFSVVLKQGEVKNSPPLESDKPVSRQYEENLHNYYGWSPYWIGPVFPGTAGPTITTSREGERNLEGDVARGDTNLRSADEIIGYHIRAEDGEIGHAEDFLVDDVTWHIRYLVIDTKNWLPGKKVLVSPEWIDAIEWPDKKIRIASAREAVKNSPEYDPSVTVSREYEDRLYEYYEKTRYWL